jgi:hypothetical protein
MPPPLRYYTSSRKDAVQLDFQPHADTILGVIKELRGKPQVDENAIRETRASRVHHQEGAAAAQSRKAPR